MSGSDNEPQPSSSKNPFVNFKRHVDARIGTGLSILTGSSSNRDTATATTTAASSSERPLPPQLSPPENMDGASKSPKSPLWTQPLQEQRREIPSVNGATRQYWNEWAQLSPYSPYNLRHLPQPVPAGASSQDAQLFDFEDAFEDLLAVSSGRDLMDLRKQAERKRRVLDTFHFGEPPMLWVNRLSNRRLLPEPLPPRHAFEAPLGLEELGHGVLRELEAHRQSLEAGMEQRRASEDAPPDPQKRTQQWESIKERMLKELDKDISFNPAKMLRQAEEMVRNLDKWGERAGSMVDSVEFDKFLHGTDEEVSRTSKPRQKAQGQQKPEPDTEEDFFSAILGSLTGVEKSLPTKSFAERPHKNEDKQSYRPSKDGEVVEQDENGGKIVRSSTKHIDIFGYLHQQTNVRKLDADGNQISCETEVIVRPAAKEELLKSVEEGETKTPASVFQSEQHEASTVDHSKSTGWFWR